MCKHVPICLRSTQKFVTLILKNMQYDDSLLVVCLVLTKSALDVVCRHMAFEQIMLHMASQSPLSLKLCNMVPTDLL